MLSVFEAMPLLLITTVIKLMIFNINGMISDRKSIFYFESIAASNQPGGIFYGIPYIDTIANIVIVIIIMQMNLFYVKMAKISTRRVNHYTH